MAVNAERIARILKNQAPDGYVKAVKFIFGLKALSQWDRAYIEKWYEDGVTIQEVEKAEKTARDANARKPIRYAAAVIENMKKAGRVESSSSFDIKDFWERAVKKSYRGEYGFNRRDEE